MTPVLIFGASRGVGLALARLLRRDDIPVLAMVRPRTDALPLLEIGADIMPGDVLEPGDVKRAFDALDDQGIVVSTVSGRTEDGRFVDDDGNRIIVDAAAARGVRHCILVTAIGCGEMMPFRSARAIAAFGDVVDAKTRAEAHLKASGVPFTLIRPGGLGDEPATGRGMLSENPAIHGFIQRADVALLIRQVMSDPGTLGKAYAAVDRDRARIDPIPATGTG
ncbi:NAD-dependent epimerase/dehydratase [Ectothiorhodospira sp. PHS-1]|uniref:SDR family oxidoreductase n=1 Tax=Ectothiorhodospira sp. PHS-1 TaxID=519989 RepID=UPI00024A8131|nr:SDR family oxidoreductase [Ectothiorhodospira sp. PHS-1]EHQ52582.1 NAD-dependent epimerase/dehydratase [Ectothiorhodospira sp. PHS-1]